MPLSFVMEECVSFFARSNRTACLPWAATGLFTARQCYFDQGRRRFCGANARSRDLLDVVSVFAEIPSLGINLERVGGAIKSCFSPGLLEWEQRDARSAGFD